jgi:hypothetical protein
METTRPSASSVSRSSPQSYGEAIEFAAVHHEWNGFGCFAKRNRQRAEASGSSVRRDHNVSR